MSLSDKIVSVLDTDWTFTFNTQVVNDNCTYCNKHHASSINCKPKVTAEQIVQVLHSDKDICKRIADAIYNPRKPSNRNAIILMYYFLERPVTPGSGCQFCGSPDTTCMAGECLVFQICHKLAFEVLAIKNTILYTIRKDPEQTCSRFIQKIGINRSQAIAKYYGSFPKKFTAKVVKNIAKRPKKRTISKTLAKKAITKKIPSRAKQSSPTQKPKEKVQNTSTVLSDSGYARNEEDSQPSFFDFMKQEINQLANMIPIEICPYK